MKVNGVGARLAITLIAVSMFISIIFIPRSQGQEEASEAPPALDKTETINIKVEFSAPQITAVREYHRVGMEGLTNFGKPGEPELPIRPVRVLIPFGSEVEGVRVSHGREVALDGFYIVEPAQKPVPLSSEAPVEFTPPDERVYNCSTPFPARIYSDPFPQSKRGYKILILSLYPVSYVPSKGELSYFEEMTVEVEFRPAPPRGLSVKCSNEDRREIMRMVDNPDAIDSYPLELGPLGGESEHEYVIITSEDLKNYSGDYDWQTLCERKESRGVTTEIVSLEWIYSNYDGRDNQEQIRNFITDAYENGGTLENWGTKYVLLGGDDTVIPPRFFWVEGEGIPSDMYYSCLDGTFNYDNDDKWGEPNDGENENEVDLYAEVYVGRAPVASGTDVSNFVRKTLAFEDFVPENRYLAYMVGEWLGWGGVAEYAKAYKEEVRLGSDNHGYTTVGFIAADDWVETDNLYDNDGFWYKYDLIDIIDNGVWALNHKGHGFTDYAMKLYNSDLDSLTNTEYFFAYSQTCLAGHFDDENCWAEKVVRMENGAAAVVMNARKGWGTGYSTNGPSQHFDREFWDAVFGENINEMGRANSDSKEDQDWYISSSSYGRWCAYELNLFGDPELHFRNLPVLVTISPGENIGLPGSTLDYKVLVWNGNREDNYTLTASDIENWDLTFSENLIENMPPYETGEVTLSVTIPENAVGTEDIITVTATSKENSHDNASCVARPPPERRVKVSVMPKENYGLPSWHVKYCVTVKNTGIENDNYELTVQDNTWPTSLSENLFTNMESIYGNGDARTTILTVTIAENAELGTNDSIIVIATSQENENVSDNTSFAVYCGIYEPIYISGNENFTPANGVASGSGTENDPYVIENWAISAESDHGIHVKNTTAHFIIQNCLVENGGSGYVGIYLDNVVNGRIQNNTCKNNGYGIYLSYSDNNTLDNNTCKNSGWYGICLFCSGYNLISNNTCKNSVWYGIYISYYSSNNSLTNNTCKNSVWYGIYLYGSDNNSLTNNTCENNSQDGIYLYGSDNNSLTNNTCENNSQHGIYLGDSDNNTLDNNTCKNNNCGIYLFVFSDYNLISNNTCKNNNCGIYLDDSDNNTLDNNTCENNTYGIYLDDSDNNTLDNNTCENNSQDGIYLYGSDNNSLTNNTCENNSQHGIYLGDSDNNTLDNNTCKNNYYGIRLYYSSNNTLDNNTCENNSQYGIFLHRSDNNRLTNNTCENNNYGILLWYYSSNNTLDNNTCENNNYGIRLYSSDNNHIYHNNFINNYNEAYDSGSNYWDNGYPSGGNYWSDYENDDNYRGENQDIPGSDGIGDLPRNIPGGVNQDNYPFMNPWPFGPLVLITPEENSGLLGENLTFTVRVLNISEYGDNFDLKVSDNENWGPSLSDNLLEVPAGGEENVTLSIIIPMDAEPGTIDNITVTATSQTDNTMSDNDSCIAHAVSPKVEFSLATLYKVNLDLDIYIESGSKLVVKFYTWGDDFEAENVVWSGTTPDRVTLLEDIPHPQGKAVKKARLDLTTDDTENVIETIASFTVCRLDLAIRFSEIPAEWLLAPTPEEKLALAIEFSEIPMYWLLAPSSAGPLGLGFPISDPGGENIEVVQGDNFLIRHTLEWDEPENGAYTVTIGWDCYNNNENENFTFLSAEAYFDLDNDNLPDPGLDPILAVVTLDSAPSWDYPGTRYALRVSCPADNKDPRDGRFNVDIVMGAYGAGGVPHIPGDHVIPSQFAGIIIIEEYPESWNRDPITIKVLGRSVSVSISPSYDGAQYGQNITFSVMVTNTGDVQDNFTLTVDNQWAAVLSDNKTSQLSPLESENFTLTVTVPASAKRGDNDKITVTATSQADNTVSDNDSCTAVCGWLQYDAHGEKTAYNIDLECQEPWRYYPKGSLPPIMASKNIITFPPFKIGRVVAAGFASTCADNQWSENENFHVLVDNIFNWLVRGYRTTNNDVLWYTGHGVYYDNDECSNLIDNLEALGWEITADNFEPITTGELENYDIVVIPQLREGDPCTGGDPTQLLDSEVDNLENFVKGANYRGLLVLESSDYGGHNYNRVQNKILAKFSFPVYFQNDEVVDNTSNWGSHYEPVVWVYDTGYNSIYDYYQAATGDNKVGLYRACSLAESADNGAIVSIYPKTKSGDNGENLTFNVIVTNSGKDTDNFAIEVVENEWACSLSANSTGNLGSWQTDNSVTLTVTVPGDASYGESDNITVKATSQSDPTVSDNYYCTAVCVT